jgi:hypothetical protein
VRAAAAEARQALLLLASTRLGVQTGSLTVSKGVVSVDGEPGRSVTYGELIGDKAFEVKFTGTAPQKPVGRYKLVGMRVPRLDIPDKVAGKYTHMQHVRVAGMLHGRVVRPRGERGYWSGAKPIAIDEASIAGIAGARVIQRGDFVGVVAEREWDAVRAARDLRVTWQETAATDSDQGIAVGGWARGFPANLCPGMPRPLFEGTEAMLISDITQRRWSHPSTASSRSIGMPGRNLGIGGRIYPVRPTLPLDPAMSPPFKNLFTILTAKF